MIKKRNIGFFGVMLHIIILQLTVCEKDDQILEMLTLTETPN